MKRPVSRGLRARRHEQTKAGAEKASRSFDLIRKLHIAALHVALEAGVVFDAPLVRRTGALYLEASGALLRALLAELEARGKKP